MMDSKKFVTLILFFFMIMPIKSEWGVEEYKSKLEEIREKIEVQRKKREEVKKKEVAIIDQINDMEREVDSIERNLSEIEKALSDLRDEIKGLDESIKSLNRKLNERKDLLGLRLRAVYKLGRQRDVRVLLSARDYEDLIRRIKFLLIIAQEDRKLAKKIEEDMLVLEGQKRRLKKREVEVVGLFSIREEEHKRLLNEINSKEVVLKKVRGERKSYEKMIAELEEASRELEALIRKAQGESLEPIEFRKPTGNYISHGKTTMPTVGTIVKPFGKMKHPIYDTITRNDGIDISAERGAQIKALMGGKVIFSDWFRGYGKLIIIDNGSGYASLYAHCDEIYVKVDDMVKSGDVIGTVGSTGTLGEVILHFEIRKDGEPLDPTLFLKGK
ncbi:MAG: murein hydrolase activator EnvC family protein [bacterium]